MNTSSLGFGLGLRPDHYEDILSSDYAIDWFEVITENYLVPGGKAHYYLDQIRSRYPVVMHGVSMSIGSTDPINYEYLTQVKLLNERVQPKWISDHLCWTGVNGKNMHDLLPLPYTQEAINHIVERILKIQDFLGQRILVENVSSYLTYQQSEISEWQFISEIANQSDCQILLDLNNIYVSSVNHGFNPVTYLQNLPKNKIRQIHLAGHSMNGNYIIDTHDHNVVDPVWDLYAQSIHYFGEISTMIERDDNIPPLSDLIVELNHARVIAAQNKKMMFA